jgi:hypothetical protein
LVVDVEAGKKGAIDAFGLNLPELVSSVRVAVGGRVDFAKRSLSHVPDCFMSLTKAPLQPLIPKLIPTKIEEEESRMDDIGE